MREQLQQLEQDLCGYWRYITADESRWATARPGDLSPFFASYLSTIGGRDQDVGGSGTSARESGV